MKKGNRKEYEIWKCKYWEVRDEEKYLYLKQLYKIKSSSNFIKVFTFGLTATLNISKKSNAIQIWLKLIKATK